MVFVFAIALLTVASRAVIAFQRIVPTDPANVLENNTRYACKTICRDGGYPWH